MKEYNQEVASERFAKLPKGVQNVILSDEITEEIRKATEAAGLVGENKKRCVEQITLVSVGLSTVKDLGEYIDSELGLSNEEATNLENVISKNILGPIKKALLTALHNPTKEGGVPTALNGTMGISTRDTDPYRESVE